MKLISPGSEIITGIQRLYSTVRPAKIDGFRSKSFRVLIHPGVNGGLNVAHRAIHLLRDDASQLVWNRCPSAIIDVHGNAATLGRFITHAVAKLRRGIYILRRERPSADLWKVYISVELR